MTLLFYISAIVAVIATILVVTRTNAVHALLYLIVSLLAAALIFFTLGAPFVSALEVIIYAGAIMVLFIFVIMMLNLGGEATNQESLLLTPGIWIGPSVLCCILAGEIAFFLIGPQSRIPDPGTVSTKQVGIALFGPYALGVELASMLLLAGLVGAYHLGRRENRDR